MTHLTISLAELGDRSIEAVLQDVANQQAIVTVVLPSGQEVVIEPKPALKPLPELEGCMPDGWKDAVYTRS